ncbi:MAG: beta-galactosidase [Kiritimatiellales bacterium]
MKKNIILVYMLSCGITLSDQKIPLASAWESRGLPVAAVKQSSAEIKITLDQPRPPAQLFQRIQSSFKDGDLIRFSADVETVNAKDDTGNTAPPPYDLNLNHKHICLLIAQYDGQNRAVTINGSLRILGTNKHRLEVEVPIQQNIKLLELRLQASSVTGTIYFRNMRLEKVTPPAFQEIPAAAVRMNENGACYWEIDGAVQPPVMYFGNNQFNRDHLILAEMEKAAKAGVTVFSFNLYMPALLANNEQLGIIERFMKDFPDAYFIPRVWLGPGSAWQRSFPEELMVYSGGRIGTYAAASSERWEEFTEFNLKELIKLIRRSPYAKQFAGLKLTYYQTGEWIYWEPDTSAGYGEVIRQGFIRWLKNRYGTLDALNTAWNTKLNRLNDITIPTEEERNTGDAGDFRDLKKHQNISDFSWFYNTAPARNICRLAKIVKEETAGKSLAATFYGYLFESAWNEVWPQQTGHLGMELLYQSPDLDIIGAPYSYHSIGRGFGLPIDMHGPFNGAPAAGKMVMIEEDTFTHLATNPQKLGGEIIAPGYRSRTTNLTETLAVLRRNLGTTAAQNQLLIWQNLFSEGRFNHQDLWDMYKPHLSWLKDSAQTAPAFNPQVAVLADPEAVTYLKTKAYGITERWLYQMRFFLNRVDVSTGYYNQSELATLSDSVRCIILLTPWNLSDAQKEILRTRFMKNNRTIIFCGITDLNDPSGFCGIQLSMNNKTMLPASKTDDGVLFGGRQYGLQGKQPVQQYLTVTDRSARVFARYASTGEPSCAVKKMGNWTSVYLGSSGLPPALWRNLFKNAGCHLYLEDSDFSTDFDRPDFVQANDHFIMIQSAIGGTKRIRFPETAPFIYRFDGEKPELAGKNCDALRITLKPGVPAYFIISNNPDL